VGGMTTGRHSVVVTIIVSYRWLTLSGHLVFEPLDRRTAPPITREPFGSPVMVSVGDSRSTVSGMALPTALYRTRRLSGRPCTPRSGRFRTGRKFGGQGRIRSCPRYTNRLPPMLDKSSTWAVISLGALPP